MIKHFRSFLIVLFAFVLLSWGSLGHKTVGTIAEHHLSAKAKAAVQDLLGAETLADVSTWADEVRSDPAYRSAAPWHYINLPAGLSRTAFEQQVTSMTTSNVYEALNRMEAQLASISATREEKATALKFVVHFIGDLHQPMHVSRAADKGGNKIQVNYEGRGTNLHTLWDSRLLEHAGLDESSLASKIDYATPAQVRQWQRDPMLQWLWESYQISSQLYTEVEQMKNRTITEDYYKAHVPIIEGQLEKAGIRLAGVLNQIFESSTVSTTAPSSKAMKVDVASPSKGVSTPKQISIESAGNHFGETVRVCSKIYGYKELGNMTLVNLGADYPNQLLTVVLKGQAKSTYTVKVGTPICVTGKLVQYRGRPEIVITNPDLISSGSK